MHIKDLVEAFQKSAENPEHPYRLPWMGHRPLFTFLAYYFSKLEIPSDQKYDWWNVMPYFPQLFVDAVEALRTGQDEEIKQMRKGFEQLVGHEVPNIPELGETNLLDRASMIDAVGRIFEDIFDEHFDRTEFDSYCFAQSRAIQTSFDRFAREIYKPQMWQMIDQCKFKGMSGVFGKTTLRSYMMAGRVIFTFARRINKWKPGAYVENGNRILNEDQLTFIDEDGDPFLLRAGLQSIYCDFRTALAMIDDVVVHWPKANPKKAFRVDKKLALG